MEKKTEHFTLCVNNNDTTKTENKKMLCSNPNTFSLKLVLLLCYTWSLICSTILGTINFLHLTPLFVFTSSRYHVIF